ncbi:BRCA1-A complex subunit Abraxas 1 [Pholidichthys leucotaenia]
MAEPTVKMSGFVLASLMFQHVNSESDVEGLVLGESRSEEQVTISDSQVDHIHIEETFNIQKHLVCQRLNSLYSSSGEVNLEAIEKLLADNKQENVIGWYRQRRNTEQQVTFRERVVHENLKSALSNPHMVFLLLTPSTMTPSGSTHRMEYAAFISRSRHFMTIPITVTNLGLLEQLSYWKVSAPCSAAGYNLTVKKHGSKFFLSSGVLKEVNDMNRMNDSLQLELQEACRQVEESERLVETLQAEVSALRRRLREEQRSGPEQEADEPPEQVKNNLQLLEAIRALLDCPPAFYTQTLTLQGFPVPEEGVSTATGVKTLSVSNCRKRLGEKLPRRERKRRRSKS